MIDSVVASELRVSPLADALTDAWHSLDSAATSGTQDPATAAGVLRALINAGGLDLPLPGSGQTLQRFRALGKLGELDLTVARLGEAHADAAAILAELGGAVVGPGELWGVWAAEPPNGRVAAVADAGDGTWRLEGRKAWCSGAAGTAMRSSRRMPRTARGCSRSTSPSPAWRPSTTRGRCPRCAAATPAVSTSSRQPPNRRPTRELRRPAGLLARCGRGRRGLVRRRGRGRPCAAAAHGRRPLDDLGWFTSARSTARWVGRGRVGAAAAAIDADPRDDEGAGPPRSPGVPEQSWRPPPPRPSTGSGGRLARHRSPSTRACPPGRRPPAVPAPDARGPRSRRARPARRERRRRLVRRSSPDRHRGGDVAPWLDRRAWPPLDLPSLCGRRVVVLAAHPDDEVLGVGGLLAALRPGAARSWRCGPLTARPHTLSRAASLRSA